MITLQQRVDELIRLEACLSNALRECSTQRKRLLRSLETVIQERDALAAEVERLKAEDVRHG